MIRQARALIQEGKLGTIRRVNCEYLQGWLAQPMPDNKQADWRTDPTRAGAAGCFGDIGSHGENLMSYVTGLEIEALCADTTTFVPGRQLEDDGNVLLRFAGGAKGVLSVSQIALGKENDLTLQVFGDRASIEWRQDDANSLIVRYADAPMQVLRSGWAGTGLTPPPPRDCRRDIQKVIWKLLPKCIEIFATTYWVLWTLPTTPVLLRGCAVCGLFKASLPALSRARSG